MWTIRLKREVIQELYRVERKIRPDLSAFIASLAKAPIPETAQLVDELRNTYRVIAFGYEILYVVEEDWIVVAALRQVEGDSAKMGS